MTGFESPNYTQTPNDLFDEFLPLMSESELKVVLHAIRQTMGYHRSSDEISNTQFQAATGLSKQGVLDGINAAVEHGLLAEVGTGRRGVKRWSLVINSDQSKILTSQESRPVKGTTGQKSRPELVNKVDTQKKQLKKPQPRNKKEPSPPPQQDAENLSANADDDQGFESDRAGDEESPLAKEVRLKWENPWEAAARILGNRNGSYVGMYVNFFTGKCKSKDGERYRWQICQPPMTIHEIYAFRSWWDTHSDDFPFQRLKWETLFNRVLEFRGSPEYTQHMARVQSIETEDRMAVLAETTDVQSVVSPAREADDGGSGAALAQVQRLIDNLAKQHSGNWEAFYGDRPRPY